jgi:hypothetical protein
MAKYNFNIPVLDLDDQPLKDEKGEELSLGKILAKALYGQHKFQDPLKLMESWARPLYKGQEIELDTSDKDLLLGLIKNPEIGLFPVVKEMAFKVLGATGKDAAAASGAPVRNIPNNKHLKK